MTETNSIQNSQGIARNHVVTEQKRRDRINSGFNKLKQLLPNASKLDKAKLLQITCEYIEQVQNLITYILRDNMYQALPQDIQEQFVNLLQGKDSQQSSWCQAHDFQNMSNLTELNLKPTQQTDLYNPQNYTSSQLPSRRHNNLEKPYKTSRYSQDIGFQDDNQNLLTSSKKPRYRVDSNNSESVALNDSIQKRLALKIPLEQDLKQYQDDKAEFYNTSPPSIIQNLNHLQDLQQQRSSLYKTQNADSSFKNQNNYSGEQQIQDTDRQEKLKLSKLQHLLLQQRDKQIHDTPQQDRYSSQEAKEQASKENLLKALVFNCSSDIDPLKLLGSSTEVTEQPTLSLPVHLPQSKPQTRITNDNLSNTNINGILQQLQYEGLNSTEKNLLSQYLQLQQQKQSPLEGQGNSNLCSNSFCNESTKIQSTSNGQLLNSGLLDQNGLNQIGTILKDQGITDKSSQVNFTMSQLPQKRGKSNPEDFPLNSKLDQSVNYQNQAKDLQGQLNLIDQIIKDKQKSNNYDNYVNTKRIQDANQLSALLNLNGFQQQEKHRNNNQNQIGGQNIQDLIDTVTKLKNQLSQ